jgi:hypothetical protein
MRDLAAVIDRQLIRLLRRSFLRVSRGKHTIRIVKRLVQLIVNEL